MCNESSPLRARMSPDAPKEKAQVFSVPPCLCGEWRLYDDGLVILAVDVPHGVGNLADGPMRFDGFNDDRHHVACAASGFFHTLQCSRTLHWVALGSQSAQTFHLLALQRLVDPLQGDSLFFAYAEGVDSDHDRLFVIDGALIFVSCVLDFLLNVAPFDGLQH